MSWKADDNISVLYLFGIGGVCLVLINAPLCFAQENPTVINLRALFKDNSITQMRPIRPERDQYLCIRNDGHEDAVLFFASRSETEPTLILENGLIRILDAVEIDSEIQVLLSNVPVLEKQRGIPKYGDPELKVLTFQRSLVGRHLFLMSATVLHNGLVDNAGFIDKSTIVLQTGSWIVTMLIDGNQSKVMRHFDVVPFRRSMIYFSYDRYEVSLSAPENCNIEGRIPLFNLNTLAAMAFWRSTRLEGRREDDGLFRMDVATRGIASKSIALGGEPYFLAINESEKFAGIIHEAPKGRICASLVDLDTLGNVLSEDLDSSKYLRSRENAYLFFNKTNQLEVCW